MVTVTLATGFITYFLAQLIDTVLAFQVGTSIFLSGLVFVVMYLIEVEVRLDTVETGQRVNASSTEDLLKAGFQNFSRATGTFSTFPIAPMYLSIITSGYTSRTCSSRAMTAGGVRDNQAWRSMAMPPGLASTSQVACINIRLGRVSLGGTKGSVWGPTAFDAQD